MTPRTTVFFIAEGPHLTAQATLLAASLRFHNGHAFDILAYVPGTDAISAPARAAFDHLSVTVEPLKTNPGLWKLPYPHGNKIFACAAPRAPGTHVFLDSDMVCVAPLDFTDIAPPGTVAMVPEGTPTWGKGNDRWNRVYAHFNLAMPTDRVHLVRRRRIEYLPYFNAGMVAFDGATGANGRGFGQLWLDTAHEIDQQVSVARKRPWLDQIALPVTLKRYGLGYNVLPDAWNFSISERPYEPDARPRLIHYHSFRYSTLWPQVRTEIARMADTLGPAHMAALTPIYGDHWFRQPEDAV